MNARAEPKVFNSDPSAAPFDFWNARQFYFSQGAELLLCPGSAVKSAGRKYGIRSRLAPAATGCLSRWDKPPFSVTAESHREAADQPPRAVSPLVPARGEAAIRRFYFNQQVGQPLRSGVLK